MSSAKWRLFRLGLNELTHWLLGNVVVMYFNSEVFEYILGTDDLNTYGENYLGWMPHSANWW